MKKLVLVAFLGMGLLANAQAYKGKEDVKLQIGALVQNGGTGIVLTNDYGIGENMSFGFTASYMLNADKITVLGTEYKPEFKDRADLKVRFNANLGSVIGLEDNMDIYPGLNLGTRNFGAHLGFRYFFTDGFGVYTEAAIPIAEYDSTPGVFGKYNNQFVFQIGATFNL
jgi:opacity protein-like surface antigen